MPAWLNTTVPSSLRTLTATSGKARHSVVPCGLLGVKRNLFQDALFAIPDKRVGHRWGRSFFCRCFLADWPSVGKGHLGDGTLSAGIANLETYLKGNGRTPGRAGIASYVQYSTPPLLASFLAPSTRVGRCVFCEVSERSSWRICRIEVTTPKAQSIVPQTSVYAEGGIRRYAYFFSEALNRLPVQSTGKVWRTPVDVQAT